MRTLIFGASRQGRVVLETLRAQGGFDILGFLDDARSVEGSSRWGLPVLGGMAWAEARSGEPLAFIVAIGNSMARLNVATRLRELGFTAINAVHPSAVMMAGATMGSGNLICAGAAVVTGTQIADDAVINTSASVDHDSTLESGAYVAPGVHTAGCVSIGRAAFIGTGALLGPGVRIGAGAVIGAGSVVLRDIPPRVLAVGCPARIVKPLDSPDWPRILGGSVPAGGSAS